MRPLRKYMGLTLLLCAAMAIPVTALRYGEASRGMNPLTRWVCSTERRERLNGVAGLNFEVEQESCNLVKNQEVVTVYASPASGWRRWVTARSMVFRFEPVEAYDSWPFIRPAGTDRVLISVPEVAAVLVRQRTLGSVHVEYAIGRTELPPGAEPQPEP